MIMILKPMNSITLAIVFSILQQINAGKWIYIIVVIRLRKNSLSTFILILMTIILEASQEDNSISEKKLLLIDFDDSFTYNIVAEFNLLNVSVTIINHKLFLDFYKENESNFMSLFCGVLLGPGPGKPKDYRELNKPLKKLLDFKDFPIMGICLGHQILLGLKGFTCRRSSKIKHGESENIDLFEWRELLPAFSNRKDYFQYVARYNSLCIKHEPRLYEEDYKIILSDNSEIMGLYSKNLLTTQFHPESVGTNCPRLFFKLFFNFMYNKVYDISSQSQWHLRSTHSKLSEGPRC